MDAMGGLCPVRGLAGRPFAAGLGGSDEDDDVEGADLWEGGAMSGFTS